ncbi:hypothetical protein ScPMuIL_007255 [Solemya velum]
MSVNFNYIVEQRCYPITNNDIPDKDNCREVANTSLPFPGCCPEVQCDSATPMTTISPSVCLDRSPSTSCEIWRNLTNGCVPGVMDSVYNITLEYCKSTCGFC